MATTEEEKSGSEFEARGDGPMTAVSVDELEGLGKAKKPYLDAFPEERRRKLATAIAAVRAKSPGIELWHMGSPIEEDPSAAWDVLLRCPSEPEFAECVGKSADKKQKSPEAMRRLAFQVVMFPSVDTFRELASRRPGLPLKIASDALAIASEEDPDFARKV